MKRIALLMLMLIMAVCSYASYDTKPCGVCKGAGILRRAGVQVDCIACGGSGRVAVSAEEKREIQISAQQAVEFMNAFHMTPEDYAIYENLIRTAFQQVPDIRECSACHGTGVCQKCGGVMNTSPDAPLCVCSNTGWCISCNGSGHITWGYKDNPHEEELLMRAKEFLMAHDPTPNPDPTIGTNTDPNPDQIFDPNSIDFKTLSVIKKGTSFIDTLLYIIGAIVVIWILIQFFKK